MFFLLGEESAQFPLHLSLSAWTNGPFGISGSRLFIIEQQGNLIQHSKYWVAGVASKAQQMANLILPIGPTRL